MNNTDNNDIFVSIFCMAYNHERYIKKALDGFIMQDVGFKYEVLIHDDASTDNTAEIIREYEQKYPDIIKPIYQTENQYSNGNNPGKKNMLRARGKYIAFCEGDDYWTDKDKLKIQVKYMEEHPECSLCVHAGFYINESGEYSERLFKAFDADKTVDMKDIVKKWLFPTASILYRKDSGQPYDIPFGQNFIGGDYKLTLFLASKGSVYYFSKPMCVYRQNSVSSVSAKIFSDSNRQMAFMKSYVQMLDEYDEYTDYKYHDFINSEDTVKTMYEFYVLNDCDNVKPLLKKRYSLMRKKLSPLSKALLYLNSYFPYIYRLLRKLKHKLNGEKNNGRGGSEK